MKKISLFLMAIIAFGLTSCDEAFVEPTPQSNPQEPIFKYNLTVQAGADISAPLDLNTAPADVEVIKTVSTVPELTGNQSIEYIAYLSNTDKFTDQITLDVVNGKISKAKIDAAFRALYGKASKPKDIFIQFAAFLADGTSRVRYGDGNNYLAKTTVTVTATPVAPGNPFIYLVGNANGWDINSDKCSLAATDGDDIFVGTFNLNNNGDNNFRFYSKLGNWDEGSIGLIKEDKATDITDKFVNGVYKGAVVEGKGGFQVKVDGTYIITVNLNTMSMKMELKPEDPSAWGYAYLVGDINNWGLTPADTQGKLISKANDGIYKATLNLPAAAGKTTSAFRLVKSLTGAGVWNQIAGPSSDANEILEFDGDVAMIGIEKPGKAGQFIVPAGNYEIVLDIPSDVLTITKK